MPFAAARFAFAVKFLVIRKRNGQSAARIFRAFPLVMRLHAPRQIRRKPCVKTSVSAFQQICVIFHIEIISQPRGKCNPLRYDRNVRLRRFYQKSISEKGMRIADGFLLRERRGFMPRPMVTFFFSLDPRPARMNYN